MGNKATRTTNRLDIDAELTTPNIMHSFTQNNLSLRQRNITKDKNLQFTT